jgi:hypothetical protein
MRTVPGQVRARRTSAALAALMLLLSSCASDSGGSGYSGRVAWRLDNLQEIGGAQIHKEGDPKLIDTPAGSALWFDGVDDAVFVGSHPLAGAATFTIEAEFRPDGGAFEQRWLHLAEVPRGLDPRFDTAPPSGPRFLFEIRVVKDRWYLDAFTAGPGYNKALMVPEKTFPLGRWYHVAQTYDGRTYRSYVDGVLQAEAEIAFGAQGPGYASIGTRINRRNYFRGAVREARFTPRALSPAEFRKLPAALR